MSQCTERGEIIYRPFFGAWRITGQLCGWEPNLSLSMAPDEQYEINLRNGHFPKGAIYVVPRST